MTQYAAVAAAGFAAVFIVAWVVSFYLGSAEFPRVFSFQAAEWPANAGQPDRTFAVGVHYFGDYLATWLQSEAASPYVTRSAVWSSNYPPAVHLLFRPLTALPYGLSLVTFLSISAAAVLVPMWVALRGRSLAVRVQILVVGVVLTGPFLSTLDRGNVQGIVSGLVVVAALLLASRHNLLGAICIGLAAALKGYPIILVVILIRRRLWLEAGVAIAVFLSATCAALLTFSGGLASNMQGMWNATTPFRNLHVGNETVAPAFNSSMYSLLQVLAAAGVPTSDALLNHYAICVCIVVIVAGLAAFARSTTLPERLLALCCCMALVPTITGAYVLSVFFAPLAVLSVRGAREWRLPTFYCVVVAVLMVPKNLPGEPTWATVASVVNPMLMLILLAAVAVALFLRRREAVGVRKQQRV